MAEQQEKANAAKHEERRAMDEIVAQKAKAV